MRNRFLEVGLLVCTLLLLASTTAIAQKGDSGGVPRFPGEPFACPVVAPIERFFVTYATDGTLGGSDCATILSCSNLDRVAATVQCEYFYGLGNAAAGAAAMVLGPGETGECATRALDPSNVFIVNANAASPMFEGKGRVCSSTKRIVCHAHLSCLTLGGARVLEDITLITKLRQIGD